MPIIASPLAPPISSRRRGERVNQLRAVAAATAHMLSEISAIPQKMPPSATICSGTCPAARLANWGSTAAKNTIALGLVAPTTKPSRSIRPVLLGGTVPVRIDASDLRCLIAWMPRKIR